jgi:hypothetical protein
MPKLSSEALPVPSPSPAATAASPSRALASAALAGLLCAATTACEADKVADKTQNVNGPGAGGESNSGSGGSSSIGGSSNGGASNKGGTASGGGAANNGGTASGGGASNSGGASDGTDGGSGGSTQNTGGASSDAGGANTGGADGGVVSPPHDAGVNCAMPDGSVPYVTSTTNVATMTQEQFTALCDARHGTVEIPPHCGGFNTCMGFSWWADTGDLTEHTCRGMSSCVGFSCVVCPPK